MTATSFAATLYGGEGAWQCQDFCSPEQIQRETNSYGTMAMNAFTAIVASTGLPLEDGRARLGGANTCWFEVLVGGGGGLELVEQSGDELCEFRLGVVGDANDFVDVGRLESIGEADIGNDGKADGAEAAVDGDDNFGDGGHTDDIGTDGAQEAIFGAGFEIGAWDSDEDTTMDVEVLSSSDGDGEIGQLWIVGGRHVGEARAESFVVDADQGVVAHEVDMVVDEHDITGAVGGIHTAAGVGDDQDLGTERLYYADGERNLIERISLVHVEATFHGDDGDIAEAATNESAAVADRGRLWKVRDIAVFDRNFHVDLFGKTSQSCAKNNTGARLALPLRHNRGNTSLDLIV